MVALGQSLERWAATQIRCHQCGELVIVGRRNALYCGVRCRVAAHRARHRPQPVSPSALSRIFEMPVL